MPTDEYLQQVTLGERKTLNGTILLREYDPTWPEQYRAEEEKISTALDGQQITLQHVGSTSVPGPVRQAPSWTFCCWWKIPRREASYVPALEEAGYVLRIREPDWYQHRMFKGMNPEVNLHVFSEGCEEAKRMLDFRDWLRTHQEDRDLYAAEKRRLARQTLDLCAELC